MTTKERILEILQEIKKKTCQPEIRDLVATAIRMLK